MVVEGAGSVEEGGMLAAGWADEGGAGCAFARMCMLNRMVELP